MKKAWQADPIVEGFLSKRSGNHRTLYHSPPTRKKKEKEERKTKRRKKELDQKRELCTCHKKKKMTMSQGKICTLQTPSITSLRSARKLTSSSFFWATFIGQTTYNTAVGLDSTAGTIRLTMACMQWKMINIDMHPCTAVRVPINKRTTHQCARSTVNIVLLYVFRVEAVVTVTEWDSVHK